MRFAFTRGIGYTIAAIIISLILMVTACRYGVRKPEHFAAQESSKQLTNTDINIIIVRAYSNALKRFPTSEEIATVKDWIKSSIPENDATDKDKVKERVTGYITKDIDRAPTKTEQNASDETTSNKTTSDKTTSPAHAPAPAPANAIVSLKENFAAADGSDTVTIGLSTKAVGEMHDKVSTVLTTLKGARAAMRTVSKNEDDIIAVPIARNDISKLRTQVDKLSRQLQQLEQKAGGQNDDKDTLDNENTGTEVDSKTA